MLARKLAYNATNVLRTLPGGDQDGVFGLNNYQVLYSHQRDKFLRSMERSVVRRRGGTSPTAIITGKISRSG